MGFDDNNRQTASGRHGASASRGGSHAYGQPPADGFGQAPHGSRPYPQGGGYASRPTGQTPYPNQRPANYGYASQADEIVRVRKKRKKHTKLKRAALIALAVVVVLVGGVAAYGAWYTSSLASNMALDAQEQSELSSVLAPSDSQMEPFYVLLVGSDNWETYGERSDALVLVRIDPVGHVITMVSVPRDTPYEYNGKVEKINQMFAVNGAAGAVTAVQDLTGVKISDYVEIEFAGLAEFVDSIGGIYVDVPYTIDYQVYTQDQAPVHIEAGNQLLNGEQCVALVRMRTAYGDDQEAIRQSNVRAMAMALMKNVLQAPPVEIPGLIQNLSQCVSTSIDLQTMISLATDFAQAGNPTIYTCTGPYKGDFMEEYGGLWLCYEDPEGWATLMKAVDAGENPEAAETTVNGK